MAITVKVNKTDKGVVGALIDLETDGRLTSVIGVLARFSYDDGRKLSPAEALLAYREYSIADLEALTETFRTSVQAVRNEASPPPNSGA